MEEEKKHTNYLKFFAMIATSMLAMFFFDVFEFISNHRSFWFSETRLFMTFIMGGAMLIIMLGFMLNMYKNKMMNGAIFMAGIFAYSGFGMAG